MYYTDYDEYLRSSAWKAKALERARIDNYRCQMCGCSGTMNNKLQCHHLSYRNLYHEDVDKDLITLCDVCHRYFVPYYRFHHRAKRTSIKGGANGTSLKTQDVEKHTTTVNASCY